MTKDIRSDVRRVLVITLFLNLVVLGIKWIVGIMTGSLSLQAEALHSVTDSANNILGLVTNQLSSPHPDREHPYGHQKFEALGALSIAVFLGIVGYEILSNAVRSLFSDTILLSIGASELWLLVLVLITNIGVALYERRVGKKLGSNILIADASHTMSDVWVTITVLISLTLIWGGERWNLPSLQLLDVWLAFPVALLVFKSGWEVLSSNIPWLIDQMAIEPESIHELVMEVEGVINCHDIASRGLLGRQIFIEMHLIVKPTDLKSAHDITETVEEILKAKFAPARILIHVEPMDYHSDQITFSPQI